MPPDPIPRIGAAIGPRLVAVVLPSCQGCPALRLRRWSDERGQHTAADCSAVRGAAGALL